MITANNCTLEHIKERNKIFFSKENVAFHEDTQYIVEKKDGKVYLRVEHKRGVAYYQVDEQTLQLNYTKLMEEIM